jgi:hypothetical protein
MVAGVRNHPIAPTIRFDLMDRANVRMIHIIGQEFECDETV